MFGPWGTLALELVPRGRYLLFRSPVSGVGVVYLVVANGVKEFDLDCFASGVTKGTQKKWQSVGRGFRAPFMA